MNITGFYHGKLRDTYRFPSKVETNDDFLEKLKEETFGKSTTYSIISDKKQLMVVSLRKWKGQSYSVFTYFIPSHDAANRPGGYLAITIIVQDYFVADREKLYSIFEEAHNKLQLEQVLDDNRILIENFDEKRSFFESLMDDITSCITKFCEPFSPIPKYNKDGESTAFNVEDCNSEMFLKALSESGKSYVSKNFISMKQNNEYKKKYEDAISQIKQLQQNMANQASGASLNAGKKEKEHDKISKLQSENAELKEQNAALERQIDTVAAAIGAVDKKIQKTKGMVGEAAKNVSNSNSPWIRFSIIFPIVNTILLAVLLYLVSTNLNGLKKNWDDNPIDRVESFEQEQQKDGIASSRLQEGSTTEEVEDEEDLAYYNLAYQEAIKMALGTSTKTEDVKINVTNQTGQSVYNGTFVNPNDILNVTCNDTRAVGYEVYASEGCTITNAGILIMSTSTEAKIYYCHPDDKDVPFERQLNKRTFKVNRS